MNKRVKDELDEDMDCYYCYDGGVAGNVAMEMEYHSKRK